MIKMFRQLILLWFQIIYTSEFNNSTVGIAKCFAKLCTFGLTGVVLNVSEHETTRMVWDERSDTTKISPITKSIWNKYQQKQFFRIL
jgi:hypothetical protein